MRHLQPKEPISIDTANEDGWTASVNFPAGFEFIPRTKELAKAVSPGPNILHFIVTVGRPHVDKDKDKDKDEVRGLPEILRA